MRTQTSRRAWLSSLAAFPVGLASGRPKGLLIDAHIHLFASDQNRFPYHPNAVYRPPAQPLEDYVKFVREAKLDHSIIVHPEPYQDDHRYLEYCFLNEPSRLFFKGTCLFDPIDPRTPERMETLAQRWPGRIVALRIHENHKPGTLPTASGAIRDRDLRHPAMKVVWRKAHSLGLAIQMHFIPYYAGQIAALASEFRDGPVILDHLARSGEGTPAEYEEVLKMAKLPHVYMKFSGVGYSSKKGYPYPDVKPLVRKTFDAFGPDRMIWGGLGMKMADFDKNIAMFDMLLDFASETDRAKIRGLTARKLYQFP